MGTHFLVALLALWTQMPCASCLPPREKLGICPPSPYRCSSPETDLCSHDYDCPGIEKCCDFDCRKVCQDPQEKPEMCPVLPFFCTIPKDDRCRHDRDCPGYEKCCSVNCAKTCVNP